MYLTPNEQVVAESALLDAMIMHLRWYLSNREYGSKQVAFYDLQDVRKFNSLYRKLTGGKGVYRFLKKQIKEE